MPPRIFPILLLTVCLIRINAQNQAFSANIIEPIDGETVNAGGSLNVQYTTSNPTNYSLCVDIELDVGGNSFILPQATSYLWTPSSSLQGAGDFYLTAFLGNCDDNNDNGAISYSIYNRHITFG